MDALIKFKRYLILSLMFFLNCSKHDSEKSTSNSYFYFNEKDSIYCKVRKEGLEYLKEPYADSLKISFYKKTLRDDGKISYNFCRYGSFIFDSTMNSYNILKNIDHINLETPTGKYDLLDNIKRHNFIVEPINDSLWSIREVKLVKETPYIKK